MPNQPTIIVTVTEEPPAYHGVDGDKVRIFAVHLTFDGQEADVKSLLEFRKWQFRAYAWAAFQATLIEKVECEVIASPPTNPIPADRLMDWLRTVADFQQQGTSVGGDVELPSTAGAGNPSARDVLGGSIAWDAPIPQDLGLTYLVKCKRTEGAWPDRLLILPLEQSGQPANTPLEGVETSASAVTISITPFGGFPGVNICTSVPPATPESLPTPLADAGRGFLASSFDPDDFRVLEAIEAKGASLVLALPVFLGFLSKTIIECQDDPEKTRAIISRNTAVAIGCQLALDPILLALGEKKSDREGVLLSGLAALIHSQLSEGEPAISAVEKAEKNKALIESVRAAVLEKAQLPVLGDGESDSCRTALAALGVPEDIVNTLFPSSASEELASVRDGLNALMAHLQSEQGIEAALKAVLKPLADKEINPAVKTAVVQFIAALDTGVNAADAVRAEVGHRMVKKVVSIPRDPGKLLRESLESFNPYKIRVGDTPLGPCLPIVNIPDSCKEYLEHAWKPAVEAMLPVAAGSDRRFQPDSVPQPLPISISPVPGAENLGDFTSRFNGVGVIIRSTKQNGQAANDTHYEPWAHANLAAFDVWQPNGGDDQPHYETLSPPDRIGIRAFLPVAVDGRQEMFLRYHGFPLSSDAYRDTIRDDGSQSVLTAQRLPFYAARDVIPSGFQKVPRLVYGRSYQWAAFAVTKGGSLPNILQSTNAPWIPKGDLGDFKDPKKGIIGELKYLRRTAVGATTIVDQERQPARIGVRYPEVFPLALDAPRLCLSAINAGVHVCRASVDLFRNADGSGQLGIEGGDTWSVDFRRLLVTNPEGKAITLFVEWCRWEKGNVAVIYTASGNVSTQNGKDLSVKAKRTDHPAGPCDAWLRLRLETEANYASLAFDPPTVTVKRKNAPAPAAGSAGDPAGTAGESSGSEANKRPTAGDPLPCHADTPPVLLLGADACWAGGFTKSAFAEIILPRVTWLDWEHWCGNRSLAMYGLERYGNEDAFSTADKHLLTASVLRSLDDEINRLLDRLPDPSVSALIVELTVIDNLLGQQGSVRDSSSPKAMSVVIDCSKISGEAFGDFTKLNTGASSYGADLRNSLIDVDKKCRLGVVVEALPIQSSSNPSFALSSDNDKKAIVIKVCEGTVARLTIRPFVEWPENGHPAFDKGIRQLAVGEATVKNKKGYVFEGATLTIEAMHDPFKEKPKDLATQHESVLQRHIDIVPIANARDYRVFFGPHLLNAEASSVSGAPPTDPWRLFSHVEVRTQRWRFSGRPIYGWIDPKKSVKHRGKNGGSRAAECPAVEQETNDAIKRFEAELFFDRDDADCEFTRVRLTGGRDELLACPWELPSATYFRHAFNFVSRYAGAMRPGSGVPLLPRRQADWSHRVAMLADAPRLEVTRPQARCIVPLTTSPDEDGPAAASPDIEQRRLAPTPPVACILEERPFAVGGLAERMLGEIVTGIGYGFEGETTDDGAADGDASRVQPLDFAKETSRDGRLSAWAWTPPALSAADSGQPPPNPSRSFVVETEGPVGLHFEEVTTPAPAWSNCQYLLRPRSLDNGVPLPEESFLGVQLRRFLDPEWIFEPGTSDGQAQSRAEQTTIHWPVQDPCIVRYKMADVVKVCGSLATLALGDSSDSSALVECEPVQHDGRGTVLVMSVWVNFLGANYPTQPRVLCEVPLSKTGPSDELALLHMPHGDGSFTMSVAFLPDDAAATEGRSTAPLIVGTFRWTLNHLVSGGSSAGTGTAGAISSGAPAAGAPAATPPPAAGSSSPADQGPANKSAMLELPVIDGQSPVVRRTAMSQPTYREWTRTAKNADFVTAMINNGIDEPVRIADLAATINGDCALAFQRRAGIAPSPHAALQNLWLCGSLENSRMPLPVHRYLVGVFTKNASRGGRKYPSFSQARLLVGRNPSLPRQRQLAEADSLTIHEMEVPAKIVVGGNLPKPLDRFTKAVIDLRATGGRPSDAEPGKAMAYRLHVRFANSPAAMDTATATVHVKTAQGTMKIPVPKPVQSLDVMWKSVALVRFITGIGAKNCENRTIDPDEILESEDSVEVTVPTYSGSGGELWADVSLLHRAVPTEWGLDDESFDQFTFDWLFSAAAAQDDRFPDRRTLVKTLAERFEAQGRFVSSSPPIPIKKFTE